MLRGPRGQLSCPLQVLLLLVPREAGEATTLLSGLFLALPRSYRLSTTGPGPGLTGKTKAPREESRERRSEGLNSEAGAHESKDPGLRQRNTYVLP